MKMDYRLTELLEKKSFEELSEEEKSFVLTHLSETEYRQQHQLISEVKSDIKEEAKLLKANDQIRVNALEALSLKHQEKDAKTIPLWLNYKIPLWTAVAALLLIFILTTPLLFNTKMSESAPNEQLVMRDTVYIEKIVNDTIEITQPADTVIKTVYISNKTKSTEDEHLITPEFTNERNDLSKTEIDQTIASEKSFNPMNIGNRTSGKSLSEDPVGRVILNISK